MKENLVSIDIKSVTHSCKDSMAPHEAKVEPNGTIDWPDSYCASCGGKFPKKLNQVVRYVKDLPTAEEV